MHGGAAPSRARPAGTRFRGDTLNTALYLSRPPGEPGVRGAPASQPSARTGSAARCWPPGSKRASTPTGAAPGRQGPWSLYLIDTAADGERSFTHWRSDAAARYWLAQPEGEAILAALSQCDLVYVKRHQLWPYSPPASRQRLLEGLAAARAWGARIAFDNNYRPRLWQDKETAKEALHRHPVPGGHRPC